jgi:hypothetical protein
MRPVFAVVVLAVFAGCGAFLGADGDDDPAPTPGGDAAADAIGAEGGVIVDGSAASDDGGADVGTDARQTRLLVFVTAATFEGLLLSASFDSRCQTIANQNNLTGTWIPWLSTSAYAPATALDANGPWYTTKGDLVATNKVGLLSGTLLHAIDADETGASVAATNVWTGTAANGVAHQDRCGNWMNPNAEGRVGNTSSTTGEWTDYESSGSCLAKMPIYCFQTKE